MEQVYCEFCGNVASKNIRNADKLISWTHNVGKDVIRCYEHRKTSKMHKSCRTYDPKTGTRK